MERDPLEKTPYSRQTRRRSLDRSEQSEKLETVCDVFLGWRFEPAERRRIVAPCDDLEECCREIDPRDLGLAMRIEMIARVPETDRAAGTEVGVLPQWRKIEAG